MVDHLNGDSDDDVMRMVEILDKDTCSAPKIRDLLLRHQFKYVGNSGEFEDYIDSKTGLQFGLRLVDFGVKVETAIGLGKEIDLKNKHRILNLINAKSPLSVHQIRYFEGENMNGLISSYEFPIYPEPMGYHADWLALGITKFCESTKLVHENISALLKSDYDLT